MASLLSSPLPPFLRRQRPYRLNVTFRVTDRAQVSCLLGQFLPPSFAALFRIEAEIGTK